VGKGSRRRQDQKCAAALLKSAEVALQSAKARIGYFDSPHTPHQGSAVVVELAIEVAGEGQVIERAGRTGPARSAIRLSLARTRYGAGGIYAAKVIWLERRAADPGVTS
jgi:hypothetical protein